MRKKVQNPYLEYKKVLHLVRLYFKMDDGAKISKHTELIYLCTLEKHSIENENIFRLPVFISRKALKHFVESRKNELLKCHEFAPLKNT